LPNELACSQIFLGGGFLREIPAFLRSRNGSWLVIRHRQPNERGEGYESVFRVNSRGQLAMKQQEASGQTDSPATLVAIIIAARRAGDRELERETRRRLDEQFRVRLSFARGPDKHREVSHAS
jgi:hypothetical protein